MKKLLMIFVLLVAVVIFSCEKNVTAPVSDEVSISANLEVGCHTYTTPEELARLAEFVKKDIGVPVEKYIPAKGINPDYVEVHCAWLHWGKCCPYAYRQYCNDTTCPICGGITIRNYVPACP